MSQGTFFDAGEPVNRKYKKHGHAAVPGTGPKGETCKTCQHCTPTGNGGKTFYKCGLCRIGWTHGPATDIRVKDPACGMWRKTTQE